MYSNTSTSTCIEPLDIHYIRVESNPNSTSRGNQQVVGRIPWITGSVLDCFSPRWIDSVVLQSTFPPSFLPSLFSSFSPLTQCVSLSSSPLGIYPLIIIIAGTIDHRRGSPSRCAAAIFITGIRSCRPHLLTYMLHPPYVQLTSCQPGNYQVMCCS